MLKLHANVSKKVPIPGQDYSSQQYTAGMEVEVSDGATTEQIQDRIKQVYALLEACIAREIDAHSNEAGHPRVDGENRLPQDHSASGSNRGMGCSPVSRQKN